MYSLCRVPAPKLVAMATDVASGLSYLECMEHAHKDVATRNCLVTEDLCVKIAGKVTKNEICKERSMMGPVDRRTTWQLLFNGCGHKQVMH